MKILSGTSNIKLSKDISKQLKLKLVNTNIKRFADGEIYIEIKENIVKSIPTLIEKKIDLFSSKVNQNLNGI